MSRANRNHQNCVQRLRVGSLASPVPGSLLHNPWTLRPKRLQWLNNLSGKHLNSSRFCARRLTSPSRLRGLKQPCDLGLCKSVTEAKIVASLEWQHSILVHVSMVTPPTPVSLRSYRFKNGAETGHDSRASAQSFSQICIRAEARRGYFPPLALQAPGIALLQGDAGLFALQHQTGPP
jgi:hypothetical protein